MKFSMGADISADGQNTTPTNPAQPAPAPRQGEVMPPQPIIKDSTVATFAQDVMEASMTTPVIVDFWATWCGPCKQLGPVLEQAVTARGGQVLLVKVDVDQNQQLASQLGVQSMPTVMAFVGGQPVDGFVGAQPASQIEAFLDKVIQTASTAGVGQEGQIAAQLEAGLELAAQAITDGDAERALAIYGQILDHDPMNEGALIGIAKLHMEAGDLNKAKSVVEMLSGIDGNATPSAAITALAKNIELAEQAEALGDEAEFVAKLASNPLDHQTRSELAILLNAKGKHDEAAQCLLDIMGRDRDWNDDGARRQLLDFFAAWGDADASTIAARRKMSTILFS